MQVHAEITIYERSTFRKVHDFSACMLISDCMDEDDAQEKALAMWRSMFRPYGDVRHRRYMGKLKKGGGNSDYSKGRIL